MKKILRILIILSMALIANFQSISAASLKDTPRLAILPYEDKASKSIGLNLEDATIVSEFLMEQFLDSGRFKIVERDKMREILAEHSLNASGLVDPLTAVAVGKLAGAQYLVAGSVTGLSTKKSGVTGSGSVARSNSETSRSTSAEIGVNTYTVIANITLRIIDLEDGTVVMAVSGTGESARTNVEFALRKEVVNYFNENPEPVDEPVDEPVNEPIDEPIDEPVERGNFKESEETSIDEKTDTDEEVSTNLSDENLSRRDRRERRERRDRRDRRDRHDRHDRHERRERRERRESQNKSDSDNIDNEKNEEDDSLENESEKVSVNNDKRKQNSKSEKITEPDNKNQKSNEDGEEYLDENSGDYYDEGEGGEVSDTKTAEYRFTIGGRGYSMVQVRNALYKATVDAIYNKDYGLLAKLDGKAKRRKV